MGSENDYNDDLLFQSGYKHKHIVDKNPYWGNGKKANSSNLKNTVRFKAKIFNILYAKIGF